MHQRRQPRRRLRPRWFREFDASENGILLDLPYPFSLIPQVKVSSLLQKQAKNIPSAGSESGAFPIRVPNPEHGTDSPSTEELHG